MKLVKCACGQIPQEVKELKKYYKQVDSAFGYPPSGKLVAIQYKCNCGLKSPTCQSEKTSWARESARESWNNIINKKKGGGK